MRVVQVNYAYDPRLQSAAALLERYPTLTGWSEALAGAGAEVLTVQQFHRSATVTRHGLRYVFGTLGEIGRAAAAFEPDVAHVNGLMFFARTWWLRRLLPQATAVGVQDHAGGAPRDRGPAVNAIRRWLMRAADGFLFSAIEQADPWRAHQLITRDQIVSGVMEASTGVRPMPQDAARAASGMTGAPSVLWVGRLNPNKDPLTVVTAFEQFARWAPGATLTMVYQEPELLDAVRARVMASPALADRVYMVGEVARERMAAFYSAADVFVIGSHHEGSGYAAIEAIACGAIPVVTAIPAFRALTRRGSIGALWPAGNADACARALIETCRRDPASERQRVIDHFQRELTWQAVGARAMAIYREISDRRARLMPITERARP